VRTRAAFVSSSMKANRSLGYAGSRGTYAAPTLVTARTAATMSADRFRQTATRSRGLTPRARKYRARRLGRCSGWRELGGVPATVSGGGFGGFVGGRAKAAGRQAAGREAAGGGVPPVAV